MIRRSDCQVGSLGQANGFGEDTQCNGVLFYPAPKFRISWHMEIYATSSLNPLFVVEKLVVQFSGEALNAVDGIGVVPHTDTKLPHTGLRKRRPLRSFSSRVRLQFQLCIAALRETLHNDQFAYFLFGARWTRPADAGLAASHVFWARKTHPKTSVNVVLPAVAP